MSIKKSEVKLNVNGKSANGYLAEPEDGGPGVLVLHSWWGLKPLFKGICDQLAEHGFVALAPDYYQGRIANTIEEAETLLKNRDNELMDDTIKAAKDHLISLRPGHPIGVLGFSMGASWALDVAENDPDVAATVLFYGVGGADFHQVKSKVLGHFGEADEWEPLDGVQAIEQEMKNAGVDATLHYYPKVHHWFVESDRPEYDSAAAKLAWERTFEFLNMSLRNAGG